MKKKFICILLVIIISIPALIPLLQNGFFVTDDGEWMVIRFTAFYSAIRDGQIPVRFLHALNSGYGYPVPTFLYPGFMYFGIPLRIFTTSFIAIIKIIMALSLIGSAVFTFLWLNKIFSKSASIIGAIVALYLPFHLYDTYNRGSIGEIFTLAWIPFILWMIERENIFFSAVGITFLIISHNILAVLFLPLIIIYMLLKIINYAGGKKILIYKFSFMLISGLGMASFFIIPVIFELPFTNFVQTKIADPTGYFIGIDLIGIISILILVIALIILLKKKKIKNNRNIIICFLLISMLSIFLSTPASTFIWKNISSCWIQFPFRILSYLIISIAFITAFTFNELKGKFKTFLILLVIGVLIISASPFISPKELIDKGDAFYYTNTATTTIHDEYMPVWVKLHFLQMPEKKVDIIEGKGSIDKIRYNNKQISFSADISKKAVIQINTIYWPGWNAYIDGKTANIKYNNLGGLMQIAIPSGKHNVRIEFGETPIRLFSDIISLISLIILILLSVKSKAKAQNSKTQLKSKK